MKSTVRFLVLGLAVCLMAGTAYAGRVCGPISDVLLAGNTGPNGTLEIWAFSDPSLVYPNNGVISWNGNTYQDSGLSTCEDNVNGAVLNLGINGTNISFAWQSDGEFHFDPCGFGADTSDCLAFNPNGTLPIASTGWTQILGTSNWVIPAVTNCGSENEPQCEPVGYWLFNVAGVGNNAFALIYAPEPSTLILFGSGLVGLAGVVRRRLL